MLKGLKQSNVNCDIIALVVNRKQKLKRYVYKKYACEHIGRIFQDILSIILNKDEQTYLNRQMFVNNYNHFNYCKP